MRQYSHRSNCEDGMAGIAMHLFLPKAVSRSRGTSDDGELLNQIADNATDAVWVFVGRIQQLLFMVPFTHTS
jgi:hypothetical protein